MEAGSKDRPSMLAPGNYVQWKSRIKRYIDTKPNHELIHYCLENPPYELGWKDKKVLDSDGNITTTTERVFETYKNVTQDIRDQLNAKAEAVQIILTGIDNDIYSTVDAFRMRVRCGKLLKDKDVPVAEGSTETTTKRYMENFKNVSQDIRGQLNAEVEAKAIERLKQSESINVKILKPICIGNLENSHHEMSQELKTVSYHKLYDILKQHQNEVNEIRAERLAQHSKLLPGTEAIVNSAPPIYDQEPSMVAKDDEMSKDKEIDKLMALISLSFKKIYKPTNNNLRTSSNITRTN
nr:hypothetical protein [Tanacetum cinerariifolium]